MVNSRSQERADAAAAAVGGDRVIALAADVGDPASVQELVDRIVESFGRLDILLNNAGQSNATPTTELAVEDWQRVLQLDRWGRWGSNPRPDGSSIAPPTVLNGGLRCRSEAVSVIRNGRQATP
ncbi:MAG: hypothetical protein QOJ30_5996 [Pseudonocardiales bacterium]|nr:hypothetical protein [Pseudonocardiales bacterium]